MTIRKDFEKILEQEPPAAFDTRVRAAAREEMRNRRVGFLAWVLSPAGIGLGFAGLAAAGLAITWDRNVDRGPGTEGMQVAQQLDPEMLREAALLAELGVLREHDLWQRLERKKWPKPKS